MLNRWSVPVLALGVLVGYAVAGPSVQAQNEAFPFAVGDTVTLGYGRDAAQPSFGSSIDCTVAEVRGIWVRCGPRSRVGGSTDRSERWLTLKYVVQITRRGD